ncbi:unnamed protein product, partial [Laminaria digitata]
GPGRGVGSGRGKRRGHAARTGGLGCPTRGRPKPSVFILPAALGDHSVTACVRIAKADNRVITSVNRARNGGSCSRLFCQM